MLRLALANLVLCWLRRRRFLRDFLFRSFYGAFGGALFVDEFYIATRKENRENLAQIHIHTYRSNTKFKGPTISKRCNAR